MGSSDRPQGLAEEEAARVALQSQSLWAALRRPLGARFEAEHRKAIDQAQALRDELVGESGSAQSLAYHHHLLEVASELSQGLLGLNQHTTEITHD